MVAAALEEAHGWPPGSVAIVPVKTSGDRIQDRPLAEVGGKALWTKELDLALLAGETDCSVHSMKDVESERPETLTIAAMLPRADVRDRLIGAGSIDALAARRGGRHQLAAAGGAAAAASARPRDRVDPRQCRNAAGQARRGRGRCDPARRGRARTAWDGRMSAARSTLDEMLPAPAQGAIGIECRSDDAMTAALARARSTIATRMMRCWPSGHSTRALGGTCHSPVAALARIEGDEIAFACEILSEDGSRAGCGEGALSIGDLDSAGGAGADDAGRARRRRSGALFESE